MHYIVHASLPYQDSQLQELREQVSSMSSQKELMQSSLAQQLSQIQQHKDQYNLLKLKLGIVTAGFLIYLSDLVFCIATGNH